MRGPQKRGKDIPKTRVHFCLPASFCRHPSLNVHGATDLHLGCNMNETFASRKTLIFRGFVAYSVSTFSYSSKCIAAFCFAGYETFASKAGTVAALYSFLQGGYFLALYLYTHAFFFDPAPLYHVRSIFMRMLE